jgi:hypothetical protein
VDPTKLPIWSALPGWGKVVAVVILAGGSATFAWRAQLLALATRYLDRRAERATIVRSLCYQMQRLQKHMIVAYHYPQVDIGSYDGILAELQNTVLNNGSMSTLTRGENDAVTSVLHESENARQYLSTQARSRRGYTRQYKEQIVSCARGALTAIYLARGRFSDRQEVRWPPSPVDRTGRPYWSDRGAIECPPEC